jgi:hypothetical protein
MAPAPAPSREMIRGRFRRSKPRYLGVLLLLASLNISCTALRDARLARDNERRLALAEQLRCREDLPFTPASKEERWLEENLDEPVQCGVVANIVRVVLRPGATVRAYRFLKQHHLNFANVTWEYEFKGEIQIEVQPFRERYWIERLRRTRAFLAVGRQPVGCGGSTDHFVNAKEIFGDTEDWHNRQTIALDVLEKGVGRLAADPQFNTWKLSRPVRLAQKPFSYGFVITGPSSHLLLHKKGYWERLEMEIFFYDAGMTESASGNKPIVGIRFEVKRQFAVKSPELIEPSVERFEKDSEYRLEDKTSYEDLEFLTMLAETMIPTKTKIIP